MESNNEFEEVILKIAYVIILMTQSIFKTKVHAV